MKAEVLEIVIITHIMNISAISNKVIYVPLCILDYLESCKHYEILYYNENIKEDILINKDSPEFKTMEINNNINN